MWNTDVVTTAPDSWSVVFDKNSPVQGQGHRVRRADLHRRRRAVPQDRAARPRHRRSVLAQPEAVRRRRRAVEGSALDHRRVLERLHQDPERVRAGHDGDRHHVAGHQEPGQQHRQAEDHHPEGRLDGMERHLDGVVEGRSPELHVHVDGLHHQPAVQAQVAYYFGEAPANPKACDQIATLYGDATHCDVFKATDEAFAKSISFWATPRRSASTARATTACRSPTGSRPGPRSRAEPPMSADSRPRPLAAPSSAGASGLA